MNGGIITQQATRPLNITEQFESSRLAAATPHRRGMHHRRSYVTGNSDD